MIGGRFKLKKPYPIPGFEPGLLRQNAVALPLAPPPLPILRIDVCLLDRFVFIGLCPQILTSILETHPGEEVVIEREQIKALPSKMGHRQTPLHVLHQRVLLRDSVYYKSC